MLAGCRVLVTGAGGFLGHHLVGALVERGARVRAMVHYNGQDRWGLLDLLARQILAQVEVVAGDVTDPAWVEQVMRNREVVFHLAALIAIPYSYHARQGFMATNAVGTQNVLEAALRLGTGHLVVTSTSEVYGTAQRVPIDEGHPLHPQSPYAASKAAADHLALAYHLSFGLPVTIVRPFNTFGPGQSARSVIGTILAQLCAGDQVALGNLDAVRDWTYVDDMVDAFLRAAQAEGAVGRVWNVASGHGRTVREVVAAAGRVAGRVPRIVEDPERLRPPRSEVERLIGDASAFRALTGWTPRTPFEEGLERAYRWVRDHPELYRPERYAI